MISRRRRQLRHESAVGVLCGLLAFVVLYLVALALALTLAVGPARAQGLDGRREVPAESPSYRGTTANAPIPAELHTRNEGGSDGAGLCVISSLRINGRYQGVPGLETLWRTAKGRPGGYSPTKLQGLLDETMPGEKWASYVGTDPAVMERLSQMGYPIGATMNTGELYGYRPIHHMVSLVHFDRSQDLACVVDNNRPGVFSWMTAREYGRRWIDSGTGWAFVWVRRASSPAGRAWLAVLAVGSVLAALAYRLRPVAPLPSEESA